MSNRNLGWQALPPTIQGYETPAAEPPLSAESVRKEANEHRDKVIAAMRFLRNARAEDRASHAKALEETIQAASTWIQETSLKIEQQIPEANQFAFVEKIVSLESAIQDAQIELASRMLSR